MSVMQVPSMKAGPSAQVAEVEDTINETAIKKESTVKRYNLVIFF
jgi:hypothetical protein